MVSIVDVHVLRSYPRFETGNVPVRHIKYPFGLSGQILVNVKDDITLAILYRK